MAAPAATSATPATASSGPGRAAARASAGSAYPALRGANQLLNASGALAAFEALRERLPISAQAVRTGLATVELPGRFQVVPGEPTIVLDVAHNPHAVAALAQNLDQMGFFPRTHAVFGAMRDKDIDAILVRMAPLVDPGTSPTCRRRARRAQRRSPNASRALGPKAQPRPSRRTRAASEALAAAVGGADPADRIVVFGSFYTVGGVLENGLPQRIRPPRRLSRSGSPLAGSPRPSASNARPTMFKQKRDPAPDKPRLEPADAVQQARTRARQRLIGAIGPARDRHHRLSARVRDAAAADSRRRADRDPAPRIAAAAGDAAGACADAAGARATPPRACGAGDDRHGACRRCRRRAPAPAVAQRRGVITESSADAGRDVNPPARPAPTERSGNTTGRAGIDRWRSAAPRRQASQPRRRRAQRPRAERRWRPRPRPARREARRAAEEQRFVVQVGAFADAEAARETRKNVEKLGMKTYTQVAQTSNGSRIRVRVGPFASRGEAEAALAKAKAAGLNAVLLTL